MSDAGAPRERTIALEGLTLAAQVWGAEDERARLRIVALHGWLDNAASFERLAPRLLEHVDQDMSIGPAQFVALDLPGHGRSQHRARGRYHFIDYVADVVQALDELGPARCVLLGHSLGAGVSALVAGTAPERVERLVMIEGLGPLTNPEDAAPRVLRDALESEARRRARARSGQARARGRVFTTLEQAVAARLTASAMDEGSARRLVARGVARGDDGGLRWRSDPGLLLRSRIRLSEGQVLAFLQAIRCPCLLVRAEDGMHMPEDLARGRAQAIGALEVVRLPGHHHLHLDAPDPVAAAVARFLGA